MSAAQTTRWKKRLRRSGLSPMARHVATVLADLRYESGLRADEPLPLSMPALAAACGMSKNTARRWMEEAVTSGWVIAAAVYHHHRQQPNQYWIADPNDLAETNRLTSAIRASEARLLRPSARPISVKRLDGVLRSKYKSAGDDAAVRGGGASDEEGNPTVAETEPAPDPAQPQAADPDADMQEAPRLRITYPERAIVCPSCAAQPGEPCRYRTGPASHHQRRTTWQASA